MSVLREYAAAVTQPTLPSAPVDAVAGATPVPEQVRFDEVVGPDGALRAAWKGLAEVAVSLTASDLRRVAGDISRLLSDDGVTYARPGRGPGPWRLDPMPLVIDAAAWHVLEIGLAQRAELLNAVLVDLYGPQRLLAEGVVPAAAVLAHPGYLRVVARPSAHDDHPLLLSAADLGRDAAGEWRVLADRTQAPSGLGYAMENRRVVSRVVPELYREAGLHRMEPYFSALRTALLESAPHTDGADPRVVVLSPGTVSETAYDQSFMASILGFPLVQGDDLTVRGGTVWMKEYGRLVRVDVILRRVDAAWSDPLELRGESQLGVAGLVEAVRRGTVRVVNGLGSGVLENPALLPYLPAACELLLGEPLRIPSARTWWCGDPRSRDHVLAHLDTLAVRTIDAQVGTPRVTRPAPETLHRRIRAEPWRYVGQEVLPMSQAPAWSPRGVSSRPLTLRAFMLRYGSSYRPLVGGLASFHDQVHDMDRIAGSKDVWVLKSSPEDADQGMGEVLPMPLARADSVTVPRILEDMYWFGRYAERAEDLLRLVLVAHALGEDFRTRPGSAGAAGLDALMQAIARLGGRWQDDLDLEFRSLLLDAGRTGSVGQSLASLREALQGVRDQLSLDTWRAFSATDRAAAGLTASTHSHQVAESAAEMLTGILSLQGVTASMIRDPGWHMIAAGHALERAVQVCHLLRATTTTQRAPLAERELLGSVLAAAESAVTHRRRYRGQVTARGVVELLVQDTANPRSVAFSLRELRGHLAALPASTGSTRPERQLADLIGLVEAVDLNDVVAVRQGVRPGLESFLDTVLTTLDRLGASLARLHFASGPRPRAFGGPTPAPASAPEAGRAPTSRSSGDGAAAGLPRRPVPGEEWGR